MRIDARARVGAQELDEDAVVPRRPRRFRIERGELLEDFRFLCRREIAAADFIDVARATGVHHESPIRRQYVLQGEVDDIGPAGDFADGPD